jgi:hypothetical protein
MFTIRRAAIGPLMIGMALACGTSPAPGADADDDSTSPHNPTVYLDVRTNFARLAAGSLPIGFSNSALNTALQFISDRNAGLLPPKALDLPARSALSVDLPLTIEPSEFVSLYAGVSGSTTSSDGIDLSSFAVTSWNVGFQATVYEQNSGLLPTITLQSTVTGSISSGVLATTTLTNVIEFSYALNSDETRGFLAGIQDTHVAVGGGLGRIHPSIIGYAGAYYQWPNDWKITARAGLQSFGGAQVLNAIHLQPFIQPVMRVDLDRVDDDGNRLFGVTAEIMWTPKPTYQLTLRTPLYFHRN